MTTLKKKYRQDRELPMIPILTVGDSILLLDIFNSYYLVFIALSR